jgi:hypothetical protein
MTIHEQATRTVHVACMCDWCGGHGPEVTVDEELEDDWDPKGFLAEARANAKRLAVEAGWAFNNATHHPPICVCPKCRLALAPQPEP